MITFNTLLLRHFIYMYLIEGVKLEIHIKIKDYLPFQGGLVLHLNKREAPLPKDDVYQVCFNLAQRFLRRSRKGEKLTDRRTDRRRTKGDQNSSLEPSVQVS